MQRAKGGTYHLDLHQSFVAIVQQVSCLAAVDPHDTKKQLASQSQRHGCLTGGDDLLDTLGEVRLQDVLFGQLALQVGGEPDSSQRPGLLEEGFGIEHGGDGVAKKLEGGPGGVQRWCRYGLDDKVKCWMDVRRDDAKMWARKTVNKGRGRVCCQSRSARAAQQGCD